MNITLSDETLAYAQSKVDAGEYTSISEVIATGVRLLQERDGEDAVAQEDLEELRAQIQVGVDECKRGEARTFDLEYIRELGRKMPDSDVR